MIYQNDRLRIVPFERDKHMTEEYRSWFHDADVTRYNSHGLFPYTQAQMEAFVRDVEQGSTSRIVWAIEYCLPGEIYRHIGNVSLQSINWVNRSAELAVVLGRERGKGYGMQVCAWILEHAFLKLGLNRVWTGTASLNHAMQRTALKIGMRQEGVFHQAMLINGEYVNIVMYGILRWMFDEREAK